jgi:hypothetical protein
VRGVGIGASGQELLENSGMLLHSLRSGGNVVRVGGKRHGSEGDVSRADI